MTIHEKLAAFITLGSCGHVHSCEHESCRQLLRLSRDIARGDLDDILGVRKPTLEDVRREAGRVFGQEASISTMKYTGFSGRPSCSVRVHKDETAEYDEDEPLVCAPTIAAAYASLFSMPDHKTVKP